MRDKRPETMLLTELTGKRVLIVEDDPLLLELVTDVTPVSHPAITRVCG